MVNYRYFELLFRSYDKLSERFPWRLGVNNYYWTMRIRQTAGDILFLIGVQLIKQLMISYSKLR